MRCGSKRSRNGLKDERFWRWGRGETPTWRQDLIFWRHFCKLSVWKPSVCVLSCIWLWDLTDCSLPGSSVHGISQARILKWVAIPFSGGSFWPRDQTHLLHLLHWQDFYHCTTWEAHKKPHTSGQTLNEAAHFQKTNVLQFLLKVCVNSFPLAHSS